MQPSQLPGVAFRIACLLVAVILILKGATWLLPKMAETARALLRSI